MTRVFAGSAGVPGKNTRLRVGKTPMFLRLTFVLLLGLNLFVTGCSGPQPAVPSKPALRGDRVLQDRVAKDESFKSADSPLPPQERARFHGLSYFPIDPALRFSVPLHRYPAPVHVRLGTNTGEIRSGLRYGWFEFQVAGELCRLQVYRLEDALESGGTQLFVPFRDATSGNESYGAGRYIDLKENTSGVYDLDFNRAYNPFCAYNTEFSCPVPPAENTLKAPVRAGEKKFH
jgi:uncharacterized protein